ncbi:thiolase-like protein, partial [Colletotrichum falcatum]
WGCYLDGIDSFDHRFFKKSGREAASLDPQQRLLLEVSYQALESGGFFGPRKPDLDVGCFIGVCASDSNDNVASHLANAFSALGILRAFVPGRISHFFGLSGPSVALDTACSLSAVAIDAACKAILHGDYRSAIAAAISIFTSPFFYQNLAAASFLSPTSARKSFDASAGGYCRGEGVGLVVLKRLSGAVADGDNVLGTLLATAVRQSSSKVPITVPYSPSQTELYRKLLATANIKAEDVTYVEAHGTETPVGDPLEFGAIKEVFASSEREVPLHFASVKGNISLSEGASGVAGLIKTLLMIQHRAIPRQVHFQSPHPKIILVVPGRISIPTETIPWTANTLVACVNNYGAAGSIAAMLVTEPP